MYLISKLRVICLGLVQLFVNNVFLVTIHHNADHAVLGFSQGLF